MNLNWQPLGQIASGGTVLHLTKDGQNRLWLAAPAGLFCRDGQGWRAIRRGVPFWRLNTVFARSGSVWAAGMPGGIIRSVNGGKTWQQCWIEQTEAPVVAIVASGSYAKDRVLLAATAGDGILRSTDGGRHWELSNFGLRDFNVLTLVAAPLRGRYEDVFALTEGGFYQSPNGGRAWQRIDTGAMVPLALAISPNFAADQMVYLGTEEGTLLVSADAGSSWRTVAEGLEAINALTFTTQGELLVGTLAGVCVFTVEALCSAAASAPHTPTLVELPTPPLTLVDIDGTLYAGLLDGLYQSIDNGRSWQPVSDLAVRRFIWYLTPAPNLWLAAGPDEGVWGSSDGGQEWVAIWPETPVLALAASGQNIWLSTPEGILASPDGGETWATSLLSATPIVALTAVSTSARRAVGPTQREEGAVWAGNVAGQIWRGTAAGWAICPTPLANGQLLGLLALGDSLVAAFWSAEAASVQLWRSDQAGQEWSLWFSQPGQPLLPQVAVGGAGVALVGVGADLYRQTENGWRRQRLASQAAPITALWAGPAGCLAALTDQLAVSADGEKWVTAVGLDGEPVVSLVPIPGGNVLLAATANGRLWQASI